MKCECCSKEFENTEHQCTVRVNLGTMGHDFCSLECLFNYYHMTPKEGTIA